MTSPRPWTAQRNSAEAVAELKRGAGSQFDPAVIDALAELAVELAWPHDWSSARIADLQPAP
jgi:HD-GYP domain-containing protein (c-di-GMP phosphodiesterase class II)